MTTLSFINEILYSFQIYITSLFSFELMPGISVGAFVVALCIISLFIRIFISGLKNDV